jgi:hypothetical protein
LFAYKNGPIHKEIGGTYCDCKGKYVSHKNIQN